MKALSGWLRSISSRRKLTGQRGDPLGSQAANIAGKARGGLGGERAGKIKVVSRIGWKSVEVSRTEKETSGEDVLTLRS